MTNLFSKKYKHKRWSRAEYILFLERLELYISAGLPLDRALATIEDGMGISHNVSVNAIRKMVEQGTLFSVALEQNTRISPALISLIRHGERAGSLAQSLNSARTFLERQDELIKKCISALVYPVVIGLCAGILTLGLLRGVMPQIIPTLKSLNVPLPLLTKIVIAISEEITHRGLWYTLGFLTGGLIFIYVYKKVSVIKEINQNIIIRVPILGKLVLAYHLSITLRSLGTLVDTGISLPVAYSTVVKNMDFFPLHTIFESAISHIEHGESIGRMMRRAYIPEYISPLIFAGESTGTLGFSMIRVAGILDRDIEHTLKRITSLIEPLMMVVMGCAVGAIALSIMMPIYDVSKVLQK